MALKKQLTDAEWDLLSITTDPILLGEFLRSTSDGSPFPEEWPKQKWKYRWYQKDLLSDKSEFIVLTGGRAIGKCSPLFARIYVYPFGYVTIRDLLSWRKAGHPLCNIPLYTVDENKKLTQRRLRIDKNGYKEVFKVTTAQGHIFEGTANHPLFTPKGYVNIEELHLGDEVGIATRLPHDSQQNCLSWEELRWFGYNMGKDKVSPEAPTRLRTQKSVLEYQHIAEYMAAKVFRHPNGEYSILRKRGPYKHYMTKVMDSLGAKNPNVNGFTRLPYVLKAERLENNKVFLEAFISTFATIAEDASSVVITHQAKTFAYDIQELLLRFAVESRVEKIDERWHVTVDRYESIYTLFTALEVPGISGKHLKLPLREKTPTDYMRWDYITSIESTGIKPTFAIYVPFTHNYISDNLLVHNSIVIEDRLIYEAVNADLEFPNATKEQVFVTPNLSQMVRLLDSKIMRFMSSRMLKDFLQGNVNRTKGTLDFPLGNTNYRFFSRIAGSAGETNMVSMHATKIKGDEMQIFPMPAFIQLGPGYNYFDDNSSQFFAGVPNGGREGNVLYYLDQKNDRFKKYRIPAHENPWYTREQNVQDIIQYGGNEETEDYLHLVLGQHGDPTFSIIPRDKIVTEPFDFYSERYSQTDKHAGRSYKQLFNLHKIPDSKNELAVLAVDTGYADPTIAQVICKDRNGVWRTWARYRMTRIPFPEQAEILDWLDNFYNFNIIAVDLGAGGGGIGLSQDLMSDRFPRTKQYSKRIHGVRFNDFIEQGEDSDGNALKAQAKSYAGQELARIITEGGLIFSEVDLEGMSQMERVAYQRQSNGTNKYFIFSDDGRGKSKDDHIFASYIVFVLTLLTRMMEKPKRKLIGAKWFK